MGARRARVNRRYRTSVLVWEPRKRAHRGSTALFVAGRRAWRIEGTLMTKRGV